MEQKATVRSHYLPITYLKHFLFDEKLFMYKKGENFFKDNINSENRILEVNGEAGLSIVGVENNLYNIGVGGISSDDIEDIFKEYGENYYNDVIRSVEGLKINQPIPDDIKNQLCTFIACMRVRTPQFKSEIDELASSFTKLTMTRKMEYTSLEQLKEEYRAISGEEWSDERLRRVRDTFIKQNYKLKYPNAHFLQFALSSLEMHANIFRDMEMVIFRSVNNRYFVTSDNPVVYFVPENKVNIYDSYKSLMSPYTELYFPLTRNLCILLSRSSLKEWLMSADRDYVDTINYNISHNSFNFIFSPIKMNAMKKFIDEYIPYPFKLTFS